ncbi:MAG: HEAT repeat domain-containing protein [Deltaproteobacteria bacterium]|nr:HEAT repeat domain-containing protein [Deltaproteobacteria bacterium]
MGTALMACGTPRIIKHAKGQLAHGDYAGAQRTLAPHLAKQPHDDALAGLAMRALFARGEVRDAVALYRQRPHAERRREFAVARLWAAMRHRDPQIRLAAVQSARGLNAFPVAREMVRRLSDPDPLVKTWAAVALSATPLGADVLGSQLEARQPKARAIAIREIGRIAGKAAFAQVKAFNTNPAPEVRQACADALGYGKGATAKGILLRLATDADLNVRVAAYTSLSKLGLPEGLSIMAKAVIKGAKSERRAALLAYGKLASAAQGTAFFRGIAQSDHQGLALLAGRQLAKWGEVQPVLNTIARALLHRRPHLRIAAINTASGVRDPVAYDLAKKALRDPEPTVRLAAIRLAQSKGRDLDLAANAAAVTMAQLCPKNELPCIEAARLLAMSGDARGNRELERLTREGTTWEARAAALGHLLRQAPTAKSPLFKRLISAFEDPDIRVALVAVEHIWRNIR